jgi:hypothetical protein
VVGSLSGRLEVELELRQFPTSDCWLLRLLGKLQDKPATPNCARRHPTRTTKTRGANPFALRSTSIRSPSLARLPPRSLRRLRSPPPLCDVWRRPQWRLPLTPSLSTALPRSSLLPLIATKNDDLPQRRLHHRARRWVARGLPRRRHGRTAPRGGGRRRLRRPWWGGASRKVENRVFIIRAFFQLIALRWIR